VRTFKISSSADVLKVMVQSFVLDNGGLVFI
jgi:hypothetical protein